MSLQRFHQLVKQLVFRICREQEVAKEVIRFASNHAEEYGDFSGVFDAVCLDEELDTLYIRRESVRLCDKLRQLPDDNYSHPGLVANIVTECGT